MRKGRLPPTRDGATSDGEQDGLVIFPNFPGVAGKVAGKRYLSEKWPNPPRGTRRSSSRVYWFFVEPAVGIEPTTC